MKKTMPTVFAKKIILVLLLGLLSSSLAHAEIRNYQYDGKLPFVKMMLNMMVAMGILDRAPVNGVYNMRNNMYGPYGMSRNRYGNRSWANNVWGDNAWSNNRGNNRNNALGNTAWGQPRWGVLPDDSYSLGNYQNNYPSNLNASDLNGWVNEPWEMSVWNNKKQNKQSVDAAERTQQNTGAVSKQAGHQSGENLTTGQSPKLSPALSPKLKQKACVTDFCGLQAPNLNGLWLSREGEMLGIKNSSYLWSDGQTRHLTGKIKLQNNYFFASADGYDQLMRFKYKLDGDYLLTMQPDGLVREFKRVSYEQRF